MSLCRQTRPICESVNKRYLQQDKDTEPLMSINTCLSSEVVSIQKENKTYTTQSP